MSPAFYAINQDIFLMPIQSIKHMQKFPHTKNRMIFSKLLEVNRFLSLNPSIIPDEINHLSMHEWEIIWSSVK